MTLAKKGSKPITVDGTAFRWVVSPDSGYDVLVVQAASGRGEKLLVTFNWSRRDYAFSQGAGRLEIKPSLVAELIKKARKLGWDEANSNGYNLFDLLSDETLQPRQRGHS